MKREKVLLLEAIYILFRFNNIGICNREARFQMMYDTEPHFPNFWNSSCPDRNRENKKLCNPNNPTTMSAINFKVSFNSALLFVICSIYFENRLMEQQRVR